MLRKIIGLDLAYANRAARNLGFQHWPCLAFRDYVAGDDDQVLDMITALHRPPPANDSAEEIARIAQQNIRTTHKLEMSGCRVIPAPAKKTQSFNGDDIKRSDDQVLMIELALVCMKLRPDFLTLVGADGDLAPLVLGLRREGVRTEIVADADGLASDLKRAAYQVIDLRDLLADPDFRAAVSGISDAE